MSATIICAVLIVIAIIGIKGYTKKLTSGYCGASSQPSVKKVKVRDKDESHCPCSRTLEVDGMSRGNCVCHVESALDSLEGMWAQVDPEKGEALVRTRQEHGNNEPKQAVKDAGYVVYNIEENSEFSNEQIKLFLCFARPFDTIVSANKKKYKSEDLPLSGFAFQALLGPLTRWLFSNMGQHIAREIPTERGNIYGFGRTEHIREPEKSIASRDKSCGCSAE